ncbi:hypothetical protein GLOTRDRAFT_94987 [Gloeophyllum trabeum ATCC 11539]|uniref:Uncharacterized protein n=1 Tax=Gloeophyllum trabeum (strain ATCC 11539 / FP-39264 / Madison 617) TaxID=670483 RepID=S7RJU5_GLOTA|nr:uncharacterized protein GLOTRDRAFT_94987 [Gloeophyllum trabeum ATCC 11539]EPQ52909.1 hypothetical protein GLOTRDRAFT_94987 [Gloeophyllum trabeum ATCC 11539]
MDFFTTVFTTSPSSEDNTILSSPPVSEESGGSGGNSPYANHLTTFTNFAFSAGARDGGWFCFLVCIHAIGRALDLRARRWRLRMVVRGGEVDGEVTSIAINPWKRRNGRSRNIVAIKLQGAQGMRNGLSHKITLSLDNRKKEGTFGSIEKMLLERLSLHLPMLYLLRFRHAQREHGRGYDDEEACTRRSSISCYNIPAYMPPAPRKSRAAISSIGEEACNSDLTSRRHIRPAFTKTQVWITVDDYVKDISRPEAVYHVAFEGGEFRF